LPNNSNTAALKEFKLTSDEINPEKIVDIACGYHYNLFVTEKGKLWAAGRKFLKRVGLDSEAPIMVNLP
jgi:alpha-tubulin suppressor-like RCC1 family protein